MRIAIATFLAGGKTPFAAAEAEYIKRLAPHTQVDVVALRCGRDTRLPEGLTRNAHAIGLAPAGRAFSSEEMARHVGRLMAGGKSRLVFAIGGPDGLPPEISDQLAETWSLSPLTFSHQLARLLLLEALYRSYDILQGGRRYHR